MGERQSTPRRYALWASLALNLVLAGALVHTFNTFWERARGEAHEAKIRRQELLADMPVRRTDIVFIGDSIIAQGLWSYWFAPADVLNLGVDGSQVHDIYYRVDQVARAAPRKVFVMVGINNLNFSDLTLDIDEAVDYYARLLDRLASEVPGAEVFVHTVLPTNAPWPRRFDLATLEPLNRSIERAGAAHGFTVIDLAARFAGSDGLLDPALTVDGLHLNALGYARWVAALAPFVDGGEGKGEGEGEAGAHERP